MCETRILSQKGAAFISQCADCRAVYIWHHNLVLNFTEAQFADFKNFAHDLDFDERALPFPDGEERAVIRTPHNDINFAFTIDEWLTFQAAIDEAVYMMEVYGLISPPEPEDR
jgi:hypothetical protein